MSPQRSEEDELVIEALVSHLAKEPLINANSMLTITHQITDTGITVCESTSWRFSETFIVGLDLPRDASRARWRPNARTGAAA